MKEYIVSTFEIFLMETPHKLLPDVLLKLKKKAQGRKCYYKNWEKRKKEREDNAEELRQKNREYREKNREEVNAKAREYAANHREERRAYEKERYEKNKEELRAKAREYAANHREERRAYDRDYKEANREEVNRKTREKRKIQREEDPTYIKNCKKTSWKTAGLNMEHFEEIYERYISTTHCDLCKVELTKDKKTTKTTKVMDHSHITGEFRNVLCHTCNCSLPKHT